MSLKLKAPPINELVIGVYFDRDIASLRPEYVGIFWNRYRHGFPVIQQQPPLLRPLNVFVGDLPVIEFANMPRYWLELTDGATLMQIQGNAFLLNWRRRNTEYPHYDAVKEFFDSCLENFFNFLEEELHE